MWRYEAISACGVGKLRNEDAMLLDARVVQGTGHTAGQAKEGTIFALADGVGSGALPHRASCRLLELLSRMINDQVNGRELDIGFMRDLAGEYSNLRPRDMASTLVGVWLRAERCTIFNTGDSRAYLFRPGQPLCRLSQDHTVAAEMVVTGELTSNQADAACGLLRSLTAQFVSGNEASLFYSSITYARCCSTDKLLLCSDGLTEALPDAEIYHLLAGADSSLLDLLSAARRAGSTDDTSIILLSCLG